MAKKSRSIGFIPSIIAFFLIIIELVVLDKFYGIYVEKVEFINKLKNNIPTVEPQAEPIDYELLLSNAKNEYYQKAKMLEDKVANHEVNKKIAYLTFDDGPYYKTYQYLDILDKYDVLATFFTTSINGVYCYDNHDYECFNLYPEYIKRGHTLANHTYSHAIKKGVYKTAAGFMDEVKKQEEHISSLTGGYITNIVRMPGGSSSAKHYKVKDEIIELLHQNGYGWVDWTAQDGDGNKLKSAEQGWNNFIKSINEDIEVILLHDYSKYTIEILPNIIEYLQNEGYVLLPLFYESRMINK